MLDKLGAAHGAAHTELVGPRWPSMPHGSCEVYLTYGEWAGEEKVMGYCFFKSLIHPTVPFLDTLGLIYVDSAYCYWLHILQATTSCGGFAASLLHAGQSSHRTWQESGVTVPVFHSLCLAALSIAFHPKILGCHKSACLELAALHCSRLQSQWSYLVADWGTTGWEDSSTV